MSRYTYQLGGVSCIHASNIKIDTREISCCSEASGMVLWILWFCKQWVTNAKSNFVISGRRNGCSWNLCACSNSQVCAEHRWTTRRCACACTPSCIPTQCFHVATNVWSFHVNPTVWRTVTPRWLWTLGINSLGLSLQSFTFTGITRCLVSPRCQQIMV